MTKIIDEYNNVFYKNNIDQYHREDGPAIIFGTGLQLWYLNGVMHREDGPAIIYSNGNDNGYYINGENYNEHAFYMIQFFNGVKLNA
jgi:hypothetical protein